MVGSANMDYLTRDGRESWFPKIPVKSIYATGAGDASAGTLAAVDAGLRAKQSRSGS